MIAPSKRKLVLVEWDDSRSMRATWSTEHEVEENLDTEPIRSVGWLLAKTRKTTLIAAHVCGHTGCVGGDIAIPNRAIRAIRELRGPKR